MSRDFVRCQFIDSASLECEEWFATETIKDEIGNPSPRERFCPSHRGVESLEVNKSAYIVRVNEVRAQCAKMTLEELDVHIAGLEAEMEKLRTEMIASRATRTEKIEGLSEDERKIRRSTKIQKEIREKISPRAQSPKSSIKKDPIAYLMERHGLTREQAEKMMA